MLNENDIKELKAITTNTPAANRRLSSVLENMLTRGDKGDRLIAEGASVQMRREQPPNEIAANIIGGEIKSPRLYDRKLSEIANIWSGDPYKGYKGGYQAVDKRYKPKGIKPTNLPSWIKEGDILVGRIGGRVTKYVPGMELHRNEIIIGVKPNFPEYNTDALRYWIEGELQKGMLRGSVQQAVPASHIRKLDVVRSDGLAERFINSTFADTQENWAGAIGSMDQLIEAEKKLLEKRIMIRQGLLRDRNTRPFNRRKYNSQMAPGLITNTPALSIRNIDGKQFTGVVRGFPSKSQAQLQAKLAKAVFNESRQNRLSKGDTKQYRRHPVLNIRTLKTAGGWRNYVNLSGDENLFPIMKANSPASWSRNLEIASPIIESVNLDNFLKNPSKSRFANLNDNQRLLISEYVDGTFARNRRPTL